MKPSFLVILFLLASCTTIQITGQYLDDRDLESLRLSQTNKQEVTQILGSPTFIAEQNSNTWYYVGRSLKTGPLSKPKLVQQKLVQLSFDSNHRLIDVKTKIDDDDKILSFDQESTFTHGKSGSALQHFIKNFGRFNSKREKKR
jgi:outer membrane protein assembly factor BamE (lipoprotein component of BamABCDE complex)